MKRFLKYTVFALLLGFSLTSIAQNDADLLRFSMTNPMGTSRFNAMGGAFGALGANFSALGTNPAGIGLYTRHELSLTMGITNYAAQSSYYGKNTRTDDINITFPQGGGIFEVYQRESGLKRLQIGFGANRLKDFNNGVYTQGLNDQSSYMHYVEAISSGYDFANSDKSAAHPGRLAYETGLLDYADATGFDYITFLPAGLYQKHNMREYGNISEMTFSFGGNWNDQLYFGMTLGVPVVDYRQKTSISESTPDGNTWVFNNPSNALTLPFNSYQYTQELRVTGSGINLKLGLIYQPLNFMRIGLAFHTPTYYSLKEKYSESLSTNMTYWTISGSDTSNLTNATAYNNTNRYNMTTPAKGVLSLGFLIKNFGAISVEGELTDYRAMRFSGLDDIDYQNEMRNVVRENYRISGVVRVGTEWKVSIVSFRAGYIWQSCPYSNEILRERWADHTVTAGLGLSLGKWNIDFAFMGNLGQRSDNFYNLVDMNGISLVNPARVSFAKYTYTLSASWKF